MTIDIYTDARSENIPKKVLLKNPNLKQVGMQIASIVIDLISCVNPKDLFFYHNYYRKNIPFYRDILSHKIDNLLVSYC